MDIVPIENGTALNQTAITKTASYFFESFFTTVVWACVILLVGLIIGKVVQRLLLKILIELQINQFIYETTKITVKADQIISGVLSKIIYFVSIIIALGQLGVSTAVLNFISLFIILLIVVLVILGVKDFIPNLIAGLLLHKKQLLCEGDTVEIDRVRGVVLSFDLLQVQLMTTQSDRIFYPSSYVLKRIIKVHSPPKKHRQPKEDASA